MTRAGAATVKARYSLSYVGLPIGELTSVTSVESSSYEARLDARVTGIATVAVNFILSIKAGGLLRNGAVIPSFYSVRETGSDENRSIQVSFNSGQVRSVDIDPPLADIETRVALRDEDKRNVVDPASASILMVPPGESGIGPGACNRTLHLFTGFVRSDMKLSYLRTEELKTRGYTGPVSVCSVQYVPIAGHKTDATATNPLAQSKNIEVRLAPVQGTPLVMFVSAIVPMPVGTASIALEEYQVQPTLLGSKK